MADSEVCEEIDRTVLADSISPHVVEVDLMLLTTGLWRNQPYVIDANPLAVEVDWNPLVLVDGYVLKRFDSKLLEELFPSSYNLNCIKWRVFLIGFFLLLFFSLIGIRIQL